MFGMNDSTRAIRRRALRVPGGLVHCAGAVLVAMGAVLPRGGGAPRTTAPGLTYTVHCTIPNTTSRVDTGDGHPIEVPADWTATVTWANGRGRIDFANSFGGIFNILKDDYILFDSTEFIVVQPHQHRFYPTGPVGLLAAYFLPGPGPDTAGRYDSLRVSVESLPPAKIADRATRHYQITTRYTHVTHAPGQGPEVFETTDVADYWLADTGVVPPNPFLAFVVRMDLGDLGQWVFAGSPFQKRLWDTVSAVTDSLSHGRPVLKASRLELEAGIRAVLRDGAKARV
ncbi:MAG TPA: hypothetical protein VMH39_00365, partial [Gemmatimonadaceae bacterium]|nr:hypothetical protein [Gemmatimonadaceae bacterium]